MIEQHDVVLVGYRGVDGSVVLDCPEISDAIRGARGVLSDQALESHTAAGASCAERLQAEGAFEDFQKVAERSCAEELSEGQVAVYQRLGPVRQALYTGRFEETRRLLDVIIQEQGGDLRLRFFLLACFGGVVSGSASSSSNTGALARLTSIVSSSSNTRP